MIRAELKQIQETFKIALIATAIHIACISILLMNASILKTKAILWVPLYLGAKAPHIWINIVKTWIKLQEAFLRKVPIIHKIL